MYELTVEADFASAHKLVGYDGDCARLHGHNWKVVVTVTAEELDEIGIALDFKKVKAAAREVAGELDHRFLNDIPPFDKINPTAENLARVLYEKIGEKVNDGNARVTKVTVWETPTSAASYYK